MQHKNKQLFKDTDWRLDRRAKKVFEIEHDIHKS